MNRLYRFFVPATVALLALTGQAMAHAHLTSASPPVGGTAAAPAALRLVFSEALNLKFSGLTVNGPAHAVRTGAASLSPDSAATLVVPLTDPVPPGTYTVMWHALSADGHKTTGRYTFTVQP